MKKNDIKLIAGVLLVGAIFLLIINLTKQEGSMVRVIVDGKNYQELSLKEDTTLTIETTNGGWNTFVIKDGYVDMTEASCPDKICVRERDIHYNHDRITCLPNNVILEIVGGAEDEVDAVAK